MYRSRSRQRLRTSQLQTAWYPQCRPWRGCPSPAFRSLKWRVSSCSTPRTRRSRRRFWRSARFLLLKVANFMILLPSLHDCTILIHTHTSTTTPPSSELIESMCLIFLTCVRDTRRRCRAHGASRALRARRPELGRPAAGALAAACYRLRWSPLAY